MLHIQTPERFTSAMLAEYWRQAMARATVSESLLDTAQAVLEAMVRDGILIEE